MNLGENDPAVEIELRAGSGDCLAPKKRHCRMVVKPFLRWAGGKTWFLNEIDRFLPAEFGDYYEPFVGGGTLFFAIETSRAFLSDSNPELINRWAAQRSC
jgi:DNA adenine methylase